VTDVLQRAQLNAKRCEGRNHHETSVTTWVAKKVKQMGKIEWEKINEKRKGIQELFHIRGVML